MNKYLHLIKYNLIFYKINLLYLTCFTLLIFGFSYWLMDDAKSLGESLMTYSLYLLGMISMTKATPKSSMMFDIKHLLALPLTKIEIIVLKSITDIVLVTPVIVLFTYGFILSGLKYHLISFVIIFLMGLTIVNIIIFNKRIDSYRMEHVKSSFTSNLKWFDVFITSGLSFLLLGGSVFTIFILTKDNIWVQEYAMGIFLFALFFFATSRTLKLLKDETRSYFILRRDLGWLFVKILVFTVPIITPVLMKTNKQFATTLDNGLKSTPFEEVATELEQMTDLEGKKVLLSIIEGRDEVVLDYMEERKSLPWQSEIFGNYPPHLAVLYNRKKVLEKMIELKPEVVNLEGKVKKRTPIYSALKSCNLPMLKNLVNHGGNINHVDIEGDNPAIFAAKKSCYGGLIYLKEVGVDLEHKNKKGLNAANYIDRKTGLIEVLGLTPVVKKTKKRGVASEQ